MTTTSTPADNNTTRLQFPSPVVEIIHRVAKEHCLLPEDLTGPRRGTLDIVVARQQAYYDALTETKLSINAIGRRFNRDRATVMSGAAAHCHRLRIPLPRSAVWSHADRVKGLKRFEIERNRARGLKRAVNSYKIWGWSQSSMNVKLSYGEVKI